MYSLFWIAGVAALQQQSVRGRAVVEPPLAAAEPPLAAVDGGSPELKFEITDGEEPWLGQRPRHSLHLVSSHGGVATRTLTSSAQALAAHGPNSRRVSVISTGLISYVAVLLAFSAAWVGQRSA